MIAKGISFVVVSCLPMKILFSVLLVMFACLQPIFSQTQDSDVKIVSIPEIVLTPEMEQAGIDGRITASLSIDDAGNVTSADLTAGPLWPCGKNPKKQISDFRTLAENTLKQARFSPKVEKGKPVSTKIAVTMLIGNVLKAEKRRETFVKGDSIIFGMNMDVDFKGAIGTGFAKPVNIPQPLYPFGARAAKVEGRTYIDIIIGEKGNVISAGHVTGELLLLPASRDAACKARFSAPIVNGKPVRNLTRINYAFVAPR